jgi:Co/Zn/Cd efflux system component
LPVGRKWPTGVFAFWGRKEAEMLEALVSFLIFVIIVCVIAAIVLWAVQRFFPEIFPPARLIVGAVALIAILYALLGVVRGGAIHAP